jgi:hypothetical protein
VASYLAQSKNGLCKSTTNSGPKSLSLVFNPALGSSGGCSTLCSQTISGSCDGNGWGATNGSTVSDYVKSLNGDICSSQTANISDTASFAAPASATASACTTSKSPVFFASDSAHPASQVTNYVAGDANHSASDFNSFIQSQSDAVLGAQNKPAVAVIGHLSSDSSLYGTDVSTDYINLAQSMGSNQVSSITGNYSVALGQISNFIVQNTQNSFALPIASGDTVYSVSVMHQGSTTWTTLNSSLWTLSGTTLSLNASANVVTGDQLMYQYHN